MLYKNTVSAGYTDTPHVFPLDMYDYTLLKSATEMHPEIAAYIQKAKPIPGKTIVLVDALGAGDYWGSNSNGDYFGEDQLSHEGSDYGYRTFMEYAYPYLEHMNEASMKDPGRRMGDKVDLAVYFQPMHRVQLMVAINRNGKAQNFVERIDNGDYPDVSMACGVQMDVCSICGSRHRVRKDYCEHARNMLNRIMPDGQKAYLINVKPRFHDISLVFLGAEKNSKVLLKVANKEAAMRKTLPAVISDSYSVPAMLDKDTLSNLSKYPVEDVMSTMQEKGLSMSPPEFQYMMLSKVNQKQANYLAARGVCFDPEQYEPRHVPEGRFDERIEAMLDYRKLEKGAGALTSTTSIVAPIMAGLYHAFMKDVPRVITNTVNAVRNNYGATAVAVGYTLGHAMAPHLAESNPTLSLAQPNPWETNTIGSLPMDEPFFKYASWKDIGAVVGGAVKTGMENPIIPGIGMGTLGYLLQKKKINDKISSGDESIGYDGNPKSMSENPWVKALMYGGGTFGGLKILDYLRNRR
jgi:hypothetical protein